MGQIVKDVAEALEITVLRDFQKAKRSSGMEQPNLGAAKREGPPQGTARWEGVRVVSSVSEDMYSPKPSLSVPIVCWATV